MKSVRKIVVGIAATLAMSTGAFAGQDLGQYAPYAGGVGFEGFYAGVLLGGFFDGTSAYLTAPDTSAISLGAAAGVNFYITESVLGGFEVQGSADFGASGTAFDALGLARVGFSPDDNFMVYGASGLGVAGGSGVYAFGGGVEVAAVDSVGIRGEILGLGTWGNAPDAVKASVGLIWHMQ